jgi:hypothetical protein
VELQLNAFPHLTPWVVGSHWLASPVTEVAGYRVACSGQPLAALVRCMAVDELAIASDLELVVESSQPQLYCGFRFFGGASLLSPPWDEPRGFDRWQMAEMACSTLPSQISHPSLALWTQAGNC